MCTTSSGNVSNGTEYVQLEREISMLRQLTDSEKRQVSEAINQLTLGLYLSTDELFEKQILDNIVSLMRLVSDDYEVN